MIWITIAASRTSAIALAMPVFPLAYARAG